MPRPMPATHYDTLKVARDAPTEVIRAAYRALSQKYHPDRNPNDAAASQSMAVLNAAYDVLSDVEKKRQYDELIESIESETVFEELGTPRPSQAWPRRKVSIHSMEETPLGRLFSNWKLYAALFLLGGVGLIVWAAAPALHKRDIELPQPSADTSPYVFQDPTLPRATPVPGGASRAARPSAHDDEATPHSAAPAATTDAGPAATPAPSKQTPAAASPERDAQTHKKPATAPAKSATAPEKSATAAMPTNLKRKPSPAVDLGDSGVLEGRYSRPTLAPSGLSWPSSSDYVGGYHQLNTDGMSQVIIDNSHNDFDVFVKVVYLGEGEPETTRAVFLSARDRFTVSNLSAGTYDLRYQNLDSGTLLRSGVFVLEESAIAGGTRHSTVSLTLHDGADDGTNTYLLSERDF